MNAKRQDFAAHYGPWALIAGGAQGIGAAYARSIARNGVNLVLVDSNEQALQSSCASLTREHGVECLPIHLDLAQTNMLDEIVRAIGKREIGMLVYNAAIGDVGPFFKEETGLDFELQKIAVNVTGTLSLVYQFARPMLARQRGGIILMSSGAGLNGSPYYTHYAATKAYSMNLAESLWYEFQPYDVDVLAVVGGMIASTVSDNYRAAGLNVDAMQTPAQVVEQAFAELGKEPWVLCGELAKGHPKMARIPRAQLIAGVAKQAMNSFLDGEQPAQNLDKS